VVAPESGEYEIGVEGDDGFRLWLDGKLVVEDWRSRPRAYKGVKLNLRKGQKLPVKIEYFQDTRDRLLRLAWRTPSEMASLANKVANSVETYLHSGAEWFDFWTNERLAGGQTVSRACPLDILPLYVRAGSIVPMGPSVQYATEKPDAPYEIRIYPGADAKFTIYEDDNETYGYERGQRATYEMSWSDKTRTLTVGERRGTFPGMVTARQLNVVLVSPGRNGGLTQPGGGKSITYMGRALQVKLDQ